MNRLLSQDITGVVPGVKGSRPIMLSNNLNSNPFIMLDHIGPQIVGDEFKLDGPKHPHRGFETLTMMFAGNLDHVDSLGNESHIGSGDIQLMNAGSGIQHGGKMWADEKGEFHEIQLWINSPKKDRMSKPFIKNVKDQEIPKITHDNITYRVFSGELSKKDTTINGPVESFANISIVHGLIESADNSELLNAKTALQNTVFLYVLKGELLVSNKDKSELLKQFEALDLSKLSEAEIQSIKLSSKQAEFLMIAGEEIKEPVAMGGPFVMNTEAEIKQAYADYRAGLM